MKIFIVAVLAVAAVVAEPEADPALVYTDGTFHTNLANLEKGVNTQYAKPYGAVYQTADKVYQPYFAAAPAAAYQPYYAAAAPYRLYKREAEAEAEPEAKAQVYSGYYPYAAAAGVYSAAYPYAAAYQPYAAAAYNPYGYQGYRGLYKREAEAEPKAQYYAGYPYAAYKPVYSPAYAYPYSYGAYKPYAGQYYY
jgi:hypothetical protein